MVRMQSGRKPITNATILRSHVLDIKKVFQNFANQHKQNLQDSKVLKDDDQKSDGDSANVIELE